jgi:Right handed beta helix region
MSYTLRGRLESRLVAALLPVAVAASLAGALRAWWPVELAALMLGVGVALDVSAYHPLLRYQAGWLALPLGALELALVMGLAVALDVRAPLESAVIFFALSWLWAQLLGHAAFPLLRPEYAEDGGELPGAGDAAAATAVVLLALTGGVAWATRPPVVHLHGVVQGPLVLDREQTLVGGVVHGGIVVTANGVTIRGTTVIGGDYGIEVREARRVTLEHVTVLRSREDGIHARRSAVAVRDCTIVARPDTQGIDISFAMHEHSEVSGCNVVGGRSGIEIHFTMASVHDNVVTGSGIALTEMSMGSLEDNTADAIACSDHSICEIEGNTAPTFSSTFGSEAKLRANAFGRATSSSDSVIVR